MMKNLTKKMLFFFLFTFFTVFLCLLCVSAAEYESDAVALENGAVARIGTAGSNGYYTSLADAFSAAQEGDTITLLTDTTCANVTVNKTLTLDGAGHTLTRGNASEKNYWFSVTGDLTFRNIRLNAVDLFGVNVKSGAIAAFTENTELFGTGTGAKNILAFNEAGGTMTVGAGCSLDVIDKPDNAAVTATVKNNGDLHIHGTIRNGSSRTDKWNRCIHGDGDGKNGTIYIYDGALVELSANGTTTQDSCAIYTNGSLRMEGGTVRAGTMAKVGAIYLSAYAKDGLTFSFTGGTVSSASALGAIRLNTSKANTRLTLGGTVTIDASNGNGVQLEGTGQLSLTVSGGEIRAVYGIYNNAKTNVTADFQGGSISGTKRAVSFGGGTYQITFTDGIYTATGSDKAAVSVMGGASSGSKITINGGNFLAKNNTNAALAIWGQTATVTHGEDILAVIYGGYFTVENLACVQVSQGAELTVYGGTFEHTGNKGDASPGNAIRIGYTDNVVGRINIYGGVFFLRGLYGGIFGVSENISAKTDYEYCVMNIQGYTAVGGTGAVRNYGTGTPHTAWAASRNRGTLHAPVTAVGAQVRYTAGSNGLRFISSISKETIDYITGIADADSICYGTIIAPRTFADSVSVFTAELLERSGKRFLDIPARVGITEDTDGSLTLRAAIVNLLPQNISLEFAATAYVQYTVNGVVCRLYASYQPDLHARSAEQVARMALTSGDPYSEAQRAVLKGYWDPETATERPLDIFLIAGQSNAGGSSFVTNAFRESDPCFTAGYTNIYYSGVSRTAVDDILPTNKVNFVQTAKVGMGKTSDFMGPELGIAKALSAYYNETTGKEAAIIKYAAGGTRLLDHLTGPDKPEGNWVPPGWLESHAPTGEKSGGLYRNFISLVQETVYYYRLLGYTDIHLCGIFWMQGESDRLDADVETYTELFAALAADMRSDLASVFDGETANTPILIGEISKGFANEITEQNLAFVALQRALPETVAGTYVISSSDYISGTRDDDPWHWTCEDMLRIGMMTGEHFLTLIGQGARIPTPEETEYVAQVIADNGTTLGRYTGLALAINSAPAGATIKLLRNVNLTGSLNLGNKNAVTLDGNGYVLTVSAADTAMRLTTTDLTFVNVQLVNTTQGAAAYGITCFAEAKLNFASGSITCNNAAYGVYRASTTATVSLADSVAVNGVQNRIDP